MRSSRSEARQNQLIAQPLVIPFVMVVVHELANRAAQRALPDEDQPLQAGLFDRADETLGECVQIRRPRGQAQCFHPCPYQKLGTCCGRCSYAPRLIRSVAA